MIFFNAMLYRRNIPIFYLSIILRLRRVSETNQFRIIMKKDIIVAGFIIAASIFFFILTLQIEGVAGYEKMGPAFWPRFNLIGMIILSGVIMLRSLLRTGKHDRGEAATGENLAKPGKLSHLKYVFYCAAILFGFILAISYLGFLPTAFVATAGLIYFLGERKKWLVLIVSFGLVAGIYLLFGKLMYVPMPRGVWIFEKLSYLLY